MPHRCSSARSETSATARSWLRPGILAMFGLVVLAASATAGVTVYHDRTTFTAALLGGSVGTDDYESYPPGDIPLGGRLGDFRYAFDPNMVRPAVVAGGFGGQALGGSPFDVFVGGDSVALSFAPVGPALGPILTAFGADFLYAPSFDTIPADTYRLAIGDGASAGVFAGNADLDPSGGSFFLGLIAGPGSGFTRVSLDSVPPDDAFLVPAYQVDDLIYAAVPEPGTLLAFAIGVIALAARIHRRR